MKKKIKLAKLIFIPPDITMECFFFFYLRNIPHICFSQKRYSSIFPYTRHWVSLTEKLLHPLLCRSLCTRSSSFWQADQRNAGWCGQSISLCISTLNIDCWRGHTDQNLSLPRSLSALFPEVNRQKVENGKVSLSTTKDMG